MVWGKEKYTCSHDFFTVIEKLVTFSDYAYWLWSKNYKKAKYFCSQAKGNISPIFKKERKKDVGNHILLKVSFNSVPGKIMEQILMEVILRHMQHKEVF